jgi:hypothetical protein
MSKSNDPSGTAIRVAQHPSLAWIIKKAAVCATAFQYRLSAKLHSRFNGSRNYRLFRYEDLLAAPEQTLRELCRFIEADFRPEMLEPQKGRHEHQPSSLTGKRQKAFDPAAATRWKQVISRLDYCVITSLTRNSMKTLGYNRRKTEESSYFQHVAIGEAVAPASDR